MKKWTKTDFKWLKMIQYTWNLDEMLYARRRTRITHKMVVNKNILTNNDAPSVIFCAGCHLFRVPPRGRESATEGRGDATASPRPEWAITGTTTATNSTTAPHPHLEPNTHSCRTQKIPFPKSTNTPPGRHKTHEWFTLANKRDLPD